MEQQLSISMSIALPVVLLLVGAGFNLLLANKGREVGLLKGILLRSRFQY